MHKTLQHTQGSVRAGTNRVQWGLCTKGGYQSGVEWGLFTKAGINRRTWVLVEVRA